jgi:glucose/arabinose dehydrogenase
VHDSFTRRVGILLLLGIIVALLVAGPAIAAQVEPSGTSWPEITLSEFASGLEQPVDITHAGDERLFVVEQPGRIRIVQADGSVAPTPFLDIADRVIDGGEQGLLGLAFHPGYEQNRYFYVNYTRDVGSDSDRRTGDTIIARFQANEDGTASDPASETILLTIDQPYDNHNGGGLAFGPDGYLYIALGDGGAGGDPENRAQNGQTLLGKILRIDVDGNNAQGGRYGIPEDNPFMDDPNVLDEIWALGLRNPWRISFDRATGDLYIADVGQGSREEVNFQPATSNGGENYGWRIMEGSECYNPDPCDPAGLVLPVAEYGRGEGQAITGGFVYRGSRYPALVGYYLFGDSSSGSIWALKRDENGRWQRSDPLANVSGPTTFGQGANGELYVASYGQGRIYHIEGPAAGEFSVFFPFVAAEQRWGTD